MEDKGQAMRSKSLFLLLLLLTLGGAAHAQPFLEALAGLDGVEIQVGLRESEDVVCDPRFAEDLAQQLRRAGLRVVTSHVENDLPGHPRLLVTLDLPASRVDLELRQDVLLARRPDVRLNATTWSGAGYIDPNSIRQGRIPPRVTEMFLRALQ
jgi:hypothetical protein